MRLQARDKKIIQYCYEQQFLVSAHIERYFFSNCKRESNRRIYELEQAGFIYREVSPITGTKTIIRVSGMGEEVAKNISKHPIKRRKFLNSNTLIHDAILTSVRLKLESVWNAPFTPETAIKQDEGREVPDGLFHFDAKGNIAIEVENSVKGKERFLRLAHRWKYVENISLVLYFATTRELEALLKKYLKEGPEEFPLGVIYWDNSTHNLPLVWTTRGEVDLFYKEKRAS